MSPNPPDPFDRALFRAAAAAVVAQFVIFKCLYPFAGFINADSYVYLQAAFLNLDINNYPVGYSKFLRVFSTLTRSDTALVAFQYAAIQASGLWLVAVLSEIYRPRRAARVCMVVAVVSNPVYLYMSNYVSSDALFLALSLAWFTTLIRIVDKPTLKKTLLQAALLIAALMVRFNALYYPLIAAAALVMAPQSLQRKILGMAITILPVIAFVGYNSSRYHTLTGIRMFTPFSGWQLANNALYAYRYVDNADLRTPPPGLQAVDRVVRHYFDTTRDLSRHPEEMVEASTMYMWDPRSPLNKFMEQQASTDPGSSYLRRWCRMAPLYTQYGGWLISQYPRAYLVHFVLPNAAKCYSPPGEFLDDYNMGRDTVARIAQSWFDYPSQKVRPVGAAAKVKLMPALPIAVAVVHVLFVLGWIGLAVVTGIHIRSTPGKILALSLTLWIANFCFSALASPVTLRYQLFALTVFGVFAILLMDRILEKAFGQ